MSQTQTTTATTTEAIDLRGEAGVAIDGKFYVFKLTMGALADLAKAFGTRNNRALFERLQGELIDATDLEGAPLLDDAGKPIKVPSGPSVEDFPAIVCALSNRAVSIDQARAIGPDQFMPVTLAIAQAVGAAFPVRDEKKSSGETTEATTTPTSPSTDTSDSPSLT